MSKKKNKKVSEGDESNEAEENNKEENDADNQKGEGEDSGKKDGGGGGGGGKNAVVLKIDLHCEGCASKVIKRIKAFEGVVHVEVDSATNKLSVTGKVDPVKLQQALQEKLHKKVELISPAPKKGKDDGKGKDGGGGGAGGNNDDGKAEKKKESSNESNKSKKPDEKKEKQVPVTTAVLKVPLHCEGCIQKINKIITKTKGYQEMKLDKQKDTVTVTGAIDMKILVESLKKHLKKDVEIVAPPKKDEKKDKENGNDKGKDGSGGGGGGKGKGKGGGGGKDGVADEERIDQANKMQVQFGYGYPMMPNVPGAPYGAPGAPYGAPGAPYGAPGAPYDPYQFSVHAPQIFSDENPNACSVM